MSVSLKHSSRMEGMVQLDNIMQMKVGKQWVKTST